MSNAIPSCFSILAYNLKGIQGKLVHYASHLRRLLKALRNEAANYIKGLFHRLSDTQNRVLRKRPLDRKALNLEEHVSGTTLAMRKKEQARCWLSSVNYEIPACINFSSIFNFLFH